MKDEQLYEELAALAEKLNLSVVKGKGDFTGGYCRVVEDRRIVLNSHNLLPTQLRVFAKNLLQFDLSNIYLLPAVREYLDDVAEEMEQETAVENQEEPVEKD